MRYLLASTAALLLTAGAAHAQSTARIFDVELGSPVGALPEDQWVDPSCGTNGGPPSLRLASFADFATCRAEADTGLHEVWFIYDDEWEYIARAYRDEGEIGRFSANKFYGQPIITSLLIDDAGLVQGYRVVTDPRAPTDIRLRASELQAIYKTTLTDAPWQCTDLPRDPEEESVDGSFLKQDCVMVGDMVYARSEGRHLRKPGQGRFDVAPEGYFESSTKLEVFARDAVRDAPCCQASALP